MIMETKWLLSWDLLFQLIFYQPNCGTNEYKDHHVNDTILLGFEQNQENLYLGVDSNVFKYRLESNAIMVFEAYQERDNITCIVNYLMVVPPSSCLPMKKSELPHMQLLDKIKEYQISALLLMNHQQWQEAYPINLMSWETLTNESAKKETSISFTY